ncbi:hypothetical protein CY35_01G060000 [Sphagnum magellanicum]|nr:hypothetical protein CY35_01G060000 [Sphagnum magellanicum]
MEANARAEEEGGRGGDRQGCVGVIRESLGGSDPYSENAMHLLPCCINYTGPAEVSTYFKPTEMGLNEEGIEMKKAAFRGRRLMGSTLTIPDGYQGFVMNKEPHQSSGRRKGTDSCSKTQEYDEWEAKSAFQQLTYWNHDTLPSSADPLHLCFDWLPLSAAIHGSVSAEEVAAMAKEQGILLPGLVPGAKRKSSS